MIRQLYRFIDWFGSIRHFIRGELYLYGNTVHAKRLPYMKDLARAQRLVKFPLNILEVGSFRGASALVWSNYGSVLCVDLWPDWVIYGQFKRNIRIALPYYPVEAIRGDSKVILPQLKQSFDIIYIDGDHSYEGCLTDLKNAIPLLKDGGVLCGDDYDDRHPGVVQAVNEIFKPESVIHQDGFFYVLEASL